MGERRISIIRDKEERGTYSAENNRASNFGDCAYRHISFKSMMDRADSIPARNLR